MTIEQKAKAYDEAIERAKVKLKNEVAEYIFPELKESEDEKTKRILHSISSKISFHLRDIFTEEEFQCFDAWSNAWLEKQGRHSIYNVPSREVILAIWDLGNEWKELTNGSISTEYGTQLDYIQKHWRESEYYLREKQGEQKHKDRYTFKSIPRLLDMIEPTDKAKSYCQKLIDSLLQEGYATDAKIVSDCLKQMNGEKVAMAVMDIEKQGEQPKEATYTREAVTGNGNIKALVTEKVQLPKFKVGDWIVSDCGNVAYIESIGETKYNLQCKDGSHEKMSIDYVDRCWHSWTIQDAKAGDVLVTPNQILVFEAIISKDGGVSYCHYDFGSSTPQFDFNKDDNWYFGKEAKVYPATKEQRDLLFRKMKEAGYVWDAEKKDLKKIEQKNKLTDFESSLKNIMEEAIECGDTRNLKADAEMLMRLVQKPAWSEDDEQYLLVCKNALRKYQVTDKWDSNIISQWLDNKLKCLRPRQWKPSVEQMKQLGWIAEQNKDNMIGKELITLYNDLKQLKQL